MKRSAFIALFVVCQLVLLVAHVHKHSLFNHYSYELQKHQQKKETLSNKKQELTHTLYACADRTKIKEFVTKKLSMKPISLSQIKRLSHDA